MEESLTLSDLKPNPDNPRQISDEKLEMLRAALKEYGDLSGIVFNRRTGHLVGGHQRLRVLPSDAKVVVTKRLDTPTPCGTVATGYVRLEGERFTYREVDWDEPKEKAANIAANKHGGEWDLPRLNDWLLELDALNYDLGLTGFTQDEIENLMAPVQKVEAQCDEDEVPEKVEPRTKPGDLYQLGRHRLLCGDSTSIDAVERLMGGKRADLVFTSPPYGVGLEYNAYDDSFENTRRVVEDVLVAASQVVDGYICLNWSDIVSGRAINQTEFPSQFSWMPVYDEILRRCGFYLWGQRIWAKPHARVSAPWSASSNRPVTDWEYLFTWSNGKQARTTRGDDSHFGVIDTSDSKQTDTLAEHPGAFPFVVAERMVSIHSESGGRVLEPFCGTGTTIIACEKTGRTGYGLELDPHYCDVIVARWEKYTGKKAELVAENREETASAG